MSSNKPKSLSELLSSPKSQLGQLAARARAKVGLTDHIRKGLAPDLGAELVNCTLEDDGTLVIRASSPEWATRLRFESERLLELGRQQHPEATQVKVRVAHPGY
ncbi:MAG: DciA family protein [Gammaproteobacteria bacterium]|jgi:hypothetical protein|nr:hypothetical protein [Chromatiales bacterium]MDP6674539.1 DciA family protein [Gammaproteobacteria bacterium]